MKKNNTTMIVGSVLSGLGMLSILIAYSVDLSGPETNWFDGWQRWAMVLFGSTAILLAGMVTLLIGSVVKNDKNKKNSDV